MSTARDSRGGAIAIRGLLVQTLVALLDITKADPPFEEITLEPMVGDDQFDFLWKDAHGSHAIQVKSTENSFTKSDVEEWAKKLQKAKTNERCRLVLVGNIPPAIVKLRSVGTVVIETKNLNLDDLVEQAAHRLAVFLEDEKIDAGTAKDRIKVVHALESKLQHYSTNAKRLTRDNLVGLLRHWIGSESKFTCKVDISRIDKYAPAKLIGREVETKILNDAWDKVRTAEKPRPHVLTFVAIGGEGKTSLVAKWAADLASQDWPGCDAVFAWTFYSQGTSEQGAASSDSFLKEALTFFGDPELANSAQGAYEKGRRLAKLVGERRALLIIDGLEPLQYAPSSPMAGELKDQGLAVLLKGLAANSLGLCVVTTRYPIPDLKGYREKTAPEVKLPRLPNKAGVSLLKRLGVQGNQKEYESLVEDVKGHALTLNLLGTYLRDAHAGDIRKRDLVKLEEADTENDHGGHAFHVMDAYVWWFENDGRKGKRAFAMLRLLGFFDRPATGDCLAALWKFPPIPGITEALADMGDTQRNLVLTRLESANLLTVNRNKAGQLLSVDSHPLLREYFAKRLQEQQTEAWRAGHRRLYKHLCANTKEGAQPTLEDLQPLYQAVAHGCQAGLQQEALEKVFSARIRRGPKAYSIKKLGALASDLGAITSGFVIPWSRVAPVLKNTLEAWLFGEAAFYLHGLGRLAEALESRQTNLKILIERGEWQEVPTSAANMSMLELALGEVAWAVRDAELSVTYVDRIGYRGTMIMDSRATHANALYQAGNRVEAKKRFREAEQIQAGREPAYPLLYSIGGFEYCDLLLTDVELEAWKAAGARMNAELLAVCQAVAQRAAQTIKYSDADIDAPLYDFALDHLTLGRAALYASILGKFGLQNATLELDLAVTGLHRAGILYMLPLGLLTRAWLRSLTGPRTGPESAQSDLDEAWEIAERGPMPLHMADIHLYRARLFFRETEYPWESPQHDLAEARKLIEKHGYWRRKEELEDAEATINS